MTGTGDETTGSMVSPDPELQHLAVREKRIALYSAILALVTSVVSVTAGALSYNYAQLASFWARTGLDRPYASYRASGEPQVFPLDNQHYLNASSQASIVRYRSRVADTGCDETDKICLVNLRDGWAFVAKTNGVYLVSASVGLGGDKDGRDGPQPGQYSLQLWRNGTVLRELRTYWRRGDESWPIFLAGEALIFLKAGERFDVRLEQRSVSGVTTSRFLLSSDPTASQLTVSMVSNCSNCLPETP